ncbi:MAG: hypothetical protein ACYC0T_19135 [Ramlibacter sp.]
MIACATLADVRAPRAGSPLRGVAAAVRARPLAAALVAAALLCGTVWVFAGSTSQVPAALSVVPSPEPAADALPDEQTDVRRGRCATCGLVVAIRELQPSGFEFTVRLRGGSMRISTAASRGSWHVGDAVMLMGGAAVSAQ